MKEHPDSNFDFVTIQIKLLEHCNIFLNDVMGAI
jgi:hypothetical protein